MRILVLTNFGMGLYKFRKELIEDLLAKENEVFVSFPEDGYSKKLSKLGCIFVHSEVDRRGKNIVKDISQFIRYVNLINKIKPDLVLTYTVKPNVYGGFACQVKGVPYLANITGLGTALEDGGILRKVLLFLHKNALKRANKVFFQNETNLNYFLNEKIVVSEQAELLPGSGVNLKQFIFQEYPKESDPIKFVFIGRVMKNKGIEEYLEAARNIKVRYPNVQFEIVGFCEEAYEEKLAKYEEEGIITYKGKQQDVRPFIKGAHATILPSYHEGLSNVLLESAAMGRPVLASNIPGCREAFDEGVTGMGFQPRNTSDLVETIVKFIETPHENKIKMGTEGRRKIESSFSRSLVVNKYCIEIENIEEQSSELI